MADLITVIGITVACFLALAVIARACPEITDDDQIDGPVTVEDWRAAQAAFDDWLAVLTRYADDVVAAFNAFGRSAIETALAVAQVLTATRTEETGRANKEMTR